MKWLKTVRLEIKNMKHAQNWEIRLQWILLYLLGDFLGIIINRDPGSGWTRWAFAHPKVGIITIGTWYRALWSPNLIQNHNKKGIQASFEIHLFWGNAPLCRVISLLKFTKKAKNYFFWPKIDQNVQFVPKNGGSPLFPRVFQFFWPRSLYHIPNVIIPTLTKAVRHASWMV